MKKRSFNGSSRQKSSKKAKGEEEPISDYFGNSDPDPNPDPNPSANFFDSDEDPCGCGCPILEPKEIVRRQTIRFALPALEYYNKKRKTNYELVDPLISHGFVDGAAWGHLNFTARDKNKNNSDEDADADAPTKLFFAEICFIDSILVTTKCVILKGKNHSGCPSCGDDIKHPSDVVYGERKSYLLRSAARQSGQPLYY